MNEELKTKIEALCQDIENQHFKSTLILKNMVVLLKQAVNSVKLSLLMVVVVIEVYGVLLTYHMKSSNEGDVLLAQGWAGPALNKARGNLLKQNYKVDSRNQYGPGYISGYSAGGERDGGLV